MSLGEAVLWFISAFLACWGVALVIRGLRGERVPWLRRRKRARAREYGRVSAWLLVAGTGAIACAVGAGNGAEQVRDLIEILEWQTYAMTPWQVGSAGVGALGLTMLVWWKIAKRVTGAVCCPRCAYDMSGADPDAETIRCPECGFGSSDEDDFVGRGRSRPRVIAALAAVLLGSAGIYWTGGSFRLSSLVPGRVLVWIVDAPGASPAWVAHEVSTRIQSQGDRAVAHAVSVAWIERVIDGRARSDDFADVRLARIASASITGSQQGAGIPFDRLADAWSAGGRSLAEELASSDPDRRERSIGTIDSFEFTIMALLVGHPEVARKDNSMRLPVASSIFEPIELSAEIDEAFASAFTDDPELLKPIDTLLGWHAYERYRDTVLEAPATYDDGTERFSRSCTILGRAICHSEAAAGDALTLLRSENETDQLMSLYAIAIAPMEGQPLTSDAMIRRIKNLAVTGQPKVRSAAWRLISRRKELDEELLESVLGMAATSPEDARRLLTESYSSGVGRDDRLHMFETLADAADPAVRLVVIEQAGYTRDTTGRVRAVVEALSDDPDPNVAAAARKALPHIED